MVKKNDELTIQIRGLGINGEGVATLDDGMTMFIPFALKGETVRVHVVAVRKSYCFGKLLEVLAASEDRVEPVCPVFAKCGGCQLQHLAYGAQLSVKKASVRETLQKVGGLEVDVLACRPSPMMYGYRNKIQIPIGTVGVRTAIGFYRTNSHDIVDVETCPLHGDWAETVIAAVRGYMAESGERGYDEVTRKGTLRHIVARRLGAHTIVCLVSTKDRLKQAALLIDKLKPLGSFSLLLNINSRDTNVILGSRTLPLYGENQLPFTLLSVRGTIEIESFFQVNTSVAEEIYKQAVACAAVGKDDVVIDAYAGIGVMSACFARSARHVYAIELCREATADADRLKAENGLMNLTNLNGDCAAVLPPLIDKLLEGTAKTADGETLRVERERLTVVLDPPRKGCDEAVLRAVKLGAPSKIVYISCNPATLSRDIAALKDAYEVTHVEPFDMFAQTAHVETVVCLQKNV